MVVRQVTPVTWNYPHTNCHLETLPISVIIIYYLGSLVTNDIRFNFAIRHFDSMHRASAFDVKIGTDR